MTRDDFFDRYGVSTWLYANRPLDEALRDIAGVGFRWIEIWADGFHLDPRDNVDLGEVARQVEALGLRVHSVHTPFSGLNLAHPRLGDRRLWRELIGQSIRDAGTARRGGLRCSPLRASRRTAPQGAG